MGWLQRYRLLIVIYTVGLAVGIREYVVSREGGTVGGAGACEASAASCFSIRSSALATPDAEFWRQHARMVEVVAAVNPDDPDTEFLKGMEALSAGNEDEFKRRFEAAVAAGVKHNHFLLQFYAQYLLDRGGNWQEVNDAINRWRQNHQLSRETLGLNLSAGPTSPADEADLQAALSRVPWLQDYRLERSTANGAEQWRLLMAFRAGRQVDIRDAVAAVTTLAIPPDQRPLLEVTCRTLIDCTARPR